MALACRVLSSVRKRCIGRFHFLALPSISHHLNFHKESDSNPLLIKLLRVSNSQIKSTLDQELCSFEGSKFPWQSLVTSLRPSEKARLVMFLAWLIILSILVFLCYVSVIK